MSTGMVILLVILVLFALGGMPSMGFHTYGWGPSGGVGIVLLVLIILLITGRL